MWCDAHWMEVTGRRGTEQQRGGRWGWVSSCWQSCQFGFFCRNKRWLKRWQDGYWEKNPLDFGLVLTSSCFTVFFCGFFWTFPSWQPCSLLLSWGRSVCGLHQKCICCDGEKNKAQDASGKEGEGEKDDVLLIHLTLQLSKQNQHYHFFIIILLIKSCHTVATQEKNRGIS